MLASCLTLMGDSQIIEDKPYCPSVDHRDYASHLPGMTAAFINETTQILCQARPHDPWSMPLAKEPFDEGSQCLVRRANSCCSCRIGNHAHSARSWCLECLSAWIKWPGLATPPSAVQLFEVYNDDFVPLPCPFGEENFNWISYILDIHENNVYS